MIGRDAELAGLVARLEETPARRVVVTGRTGVGKTTFALAVAEHLAGGAAATVDVVAVGEARDSTEVLVRLGRQLGVAGTGSDLAPAIVDRITRAPSVVVLDDCDDADVLRDVLERLDGVDSPLVLTARQAPPLDEAVVVRLLPFPPPHEGQGPAEVRENPGVRLFVARAREIDPTFQPDDADVLAVGDLVRRLDGLPLAVTLAAARSSLMRPGAMVREMRRHGSWQLVGLSLADELDANLGRLDGDARSVLGALRVFTGGATIDALHAVAGLPEVPDTVAALGRLADLDLVAADTTRARYALTSAVANHVAGGCDVHEVGEEADGLDELRRRHAFHFADRAHPRSRDERDRRLTIDHGNRLLALEWLEANGAHDRTLQLLVHMGDDFEQRGEQGVARRRLATALARIADPEPKVAARAHLLIAKFAAETQEPTDRELAIDHLVSARRCALASEHEPTLLSVLFTICEFHTLLRCFALADEAITDGLARTAGRHPYAEVGFLTWRAVMLHQAGDGGAAAPVCADAIEKAVAIGDRRLIVRSCLVFLGLPGSARASVVLDMPGTDELVAMAQADDDVRGAGWIMALVAANAVEAGEGTRAAAVARDVLSLSRRRANAPLGRLGLAVAVRLAAGAGHLETGARMLGALDRHRANLESSIAPHSYASFERACARIEAELGAERFDAEHGRGGAMPWDEHVDAAAAFLDGIVAGTIPWRTADESPIDRLSPRERDVLRGLVAGASNKDIAARLDLRPKTVTHHCSAIFRKLEVESRAGAVAVALRHGFDAG